MAAPDVVTTYPADSDTGIPTGATLLVYFDRGVDLKTIKDHVFLIGSDLDITSGPGSAMWVDDETGNNPYFLTSPGFKGVKEIDYELVYYTLGTTTEVDPGDLTSEADETTASVGHLLKLTPSTGVWAADTEYTLHIVGNPDSLDDVGIAARTVFDQIADAGNTGSGDINIYGTWEGSVADSINVKITTAGNIGTAEYKWWYTSLGEGSAVTDRVTNRRYRTLDDGLQLQFTGSSFEVDDLWVTGVEPATRQADSYAVSFTTNDGSYTAAPDSPSTPASTTPPSSVLPSYGTPAFAVESMEPLNAAFNISPNNRQIVIVFNQDIDDSTITDASVTLWKYPVSGPYDDTYEPVEFEKTLSVSGDTLTIDF